MTLDPEVQQLLDLIKAVGRPALDSLPPPEAREAYKAGRTVLQPEPADVASVRDLTVPGPGGPIPVRLYRAIGTDGGQKLPCLVYYHGGGWVIGDIDSHDVLCRRLANGANCAVLSVDYRLAPEHKFPAAFDDAVAAMRFAVDQAEQIGVDPNRVAVGGDSAGGNLAAAAALAARDAGLGLTYQVLIYPATDMTMSLDSYKRVTDGFPLVARTMDWFVGHYLRSEADKYDWRASPLRAASLRGTAPAIVIVAAHDPLADDGLAYARRLEQDGVRVISSYFSGQLHGFVSMGKLLRASDTALETISAVLRNAWA
jgi:acetyl esterase